MFPRFALQLTLLCFAGLTYWWNQRSQQTTAVGAPRPTGARSLLSTACADKLLTPQVQVWKLSSRKRRAQRRRLHAPWSSWWLGALASLLRSQQCVR